MLDVTMLQWAGVSILDENTDVKNPLIAPIRRGREVAIELGGRLLLRYIRESEVKSHSHHAVFGALTGPAWCSPTPYSSRDAIHALAWPFSTDAPTHVLLLNPAEIPEIQGPHRVRYGSGIEYYLPNGYPEKALVLPWGRKVC